MSRNIETNLFDNCNYFTNCVVEVLENSITGETSVGWYKTEYTKEVDSLEEAYNDTIGE